MPIVLEPAGEKKTPRSEYEGKFSLQYAVASMLVRGHVGVTDFTEAAIADPDVLAVAAKVSHEPRAFATYPEAFPGAARVVLASGETLERELAYQKARAREPVVGSRRACEVPRQRRARAAGRTWQPRSRRRSSRSRSEDDVTAALAPLTLREAATV